MVVFELNFVLGVFDFFRVWRRVSKSRHSKCKYSHKAYDKKKKEKKKILSMYVFMMFRVYD